MPVVIHSPQRIELLLMLTPSDIIVNSIAIILISSTSSSFLAYIVARHCRCRKLCVITMIYVM